MKIALDWIAEYLSSVPSAQVAADTLMNAGLPVESIADAEGAKAPTQVLDVEVTSNRADCLSHVGLARELAALTGANFSPPKITLVEAPATPASPPAAELAKVTIDDPHDCPYYSARILRNVKVGPSPEWLRRRLESIGLRPVNNIVDITNYVLMETGQPLHAFDCDTLQEHKIIVRRAAAGESLVAIDGKTYALDGSMVVIADAGGPAAIAGIMGGKRTEVTGQTANILLESARFDPLSIRTTSRALGLKSDSSYRFERGLDPAAADFASRRAAQLMLQLGATSQTQVARGVIAAGSPPAKPLRIAMRFARFERIVGIGINRERALAILTALGFSPWIDDEPGEAHDCICVCVPSHRLDVTREIDLIEELARVLGYSHIPTLDRVTHPVSPEPVAEKAARSILRTMTEAGFSEAVTVTFIAEEAAQPFADPGAHLIHPQHAGWKSDVLRPSLFSSLLAVRRTNQNAGIHDARLFEKAEVFLQPADPAAAPIRRQILAAVASDLSALTALLALLPERLNGTSAAIMRAAPKDFPFFARGASAEIQLATRDSAGTAQDARIGRVGIFMADIQRQYDLRSVVCGLELDWDALLSIFTPVRRAAPVPRFPGVKRDLSVVLAESVRWAEIKAALAGKTAAAPPLAFLESIDFVTTFRGKDIGPDKKSLTLTLDFRDPARTLKSEEVDAQVKTAVEILHRNFAAVLRA